MIYFRYTKAAININFRQRWEDLAAEGQLLSKSIEEISRYRRMVEQSCDALTARSSSYEGMMAPTAIDVESCWLAVSTEHLCPGRSQ